MAWKDIASDTLSAGRLWTPEVQLDLMERDWALFSVPLDFAMTTATKSPAGSVGFSIVVVYPDDWGLDTSFDADMALRLSVYFQLSGTQGDELVTVAFDDDPVSNATNTGSTPTWAEAVKSYAVLPTGVTTEDLTLTVGVSPGSPGSEDGTAERAWGNGPDSAFYFTY